jgi:hypothetical protein
MAFVNKLGNLVKKATSSNLSFFQSIRCMSSSKVFIGGLETHFFYLYLFLYVLI